MALLQLKLGGATAWEFDHDLPVLWPWLFDAKAITESRRLHNTVFDAAERFHSHGGKLAGHEYFSSITAIFDDIRPDQFPRDLNAPPDEILSLDLSELEAQRPYSHEANAAAWDAFFAAPSLEKWNEAKLNALTLRGGVQRDALALAARAEELFHDRSERAKALVHLLFGRPVSRPARALTHNWIERAERFPAAMFTPKIPIWRRLIP
ncbi:hypothetical protein BH09SUM1_BH09SUM1_25710 [soil metagenome]